MLKKSLLLWVTAVGFAFAAEKPAAPARHAITHEDVWLMKRLGAPIPSPDGKWVVYALTDPAYDAKDQWSDLWIKSLVDDSPARRLTFSKGGEGGPGWSSDSTKLAFSAKREGDEAAQIYVLNLSGGEAERVTNLTLGASTPKWSPDGKSLLFLSQVYPGALDEEANKKAAKERKDRKYNVRAYEQFPTRFWNHWLDEKQLHPFVQEARAGAKARDLFAGTKLAAMRGFGGPNGNDGENLEVEWTPDGAGFVFSATTNRDEGVRAPVVFRIYLAKLDGGEPQALTSGTGSYHDISFSPDGRTLLCTFDPNTLDKVYDLSRLASFPWPFRDERKVLTASLDRSIGSYAAPADSDRIYFGYEASGLVQLHSVSYAGGDVRDEPSPATGAVGGLHAGGKALVGTWESAVNPPEIYSFNGAPKALTSVNTAAAAKIDWLPLEHFWFKASDGRHIHNMLVKPAGFDPAKKYPLFVVIHGGAANMWQDAFVIRWNYHLLAQPGYVLLLTDYKGSTGYGEEFARSIQSDPLKGPATELNEAADEAIKRYSFIDASRQAAGGASYGGHLANWLQATTTRYKAIVSHAGEMDLAMQWGTSDAIRDREVNSGTPIWGGSRVWSEQSPAMQAGNHEKGTGFVTPILITVGELDFRVPMNNALMNFTMQQRLNVPSRLLVFPEDGHHILRGEDSRYWYGEVHAWLAKYLR